MIVKVIIKEVFMIFLTNYPVYKTEKHLHCKLKPALSVKPSDRSSNLVRKNAKFYNFTCPKHIVRVFAEPNVLIKTS